MAEDLTFTFDTSPFAKGMDALGKGMSSVKKGMGNMAKSISKGVTGALAKIGMLAIAFKGIKTALNNMPEIGQAFGIAKDIFLKNLLWPLRKAVMPMLQRLLNWVRDNRTMFIKWGQTLANIFNTVVKIVQDVIDLGGKLTESFLGLFNRVFGMSVKDLEELLNVLTVKFVAALTFITVMIEPIIQAIQPLVDIIATGLAGAWETVISLVGGFMQGLEGIGTPIANIMRNVQMILDNLFSINEEGHSLQTIFETVGQIIGGVVKFITEMADSFIEGFAPVLTQMVTPLGEIFNKIKGIVDMLFSGEEALGGWKDIFEFLGSFIGGALKIALEAVSGVLGVISDIIDAVLNPQLPELIKQSIKRDIETLGAEAAYNKAISAGFKPEQLVDLFTSVDDAVITKDGKVIKTNPEDDIIATKTGLSGNRTVNLDFSGMQLIMQTATKEEATMVGNTIVDTIRQGLTMELEREGI